MAWADDLVYRVAGLEEIVGLRHAVLRPGLPVESAAFDGDDDAATLHAGAFDAAGDCVGCASFMREDYEGRPAYRLRGMATRGDAQQRGVGRRLLAFCTEWILANSDVRLLWCNARIEACGFYEREGWRIDSEVFEIPTVGPHYRMVREVGAEGT